MGLSQKKLAEQAEVSLPVVQEFETRSGRIPMEKNLRDIRAVLMRYGVELQVVGDGRAAVIFVDKDAKLAPAQTDEAPPGDDEGAGK